MNGRREFAFARSWRLQALLKTAAPLICLTAAVTTAGASAEGGRSDRIWTIPGAVDFALENNPDAAIARARLVAAQADLERAKAAYAPTVSVGSSYEGTNSAGRAFGWILNQGAFEPGLNFNRPGTTDNWNVYAMVTWSLYDGGRRAGTRAAARALSEAEAARREAVRQEIAFGVVRSMLEIGRADEIVRGVEARLRALGEAVKVAEARVARGALLESDALHIRVERAEVEEDLVRARHAASLARRAFVHLLGLSYSEPVLEIGEVARWIPSPDIVKPDRPEMKAVRHQRDASAGEVEAARGERRPRIDLFGRLDRDKGWETGRGEDSWSAGISVTYDLWDGGAADGGIRAANARRSEAIETERKIALAIEDEVERARLALDEAQARLEVAGEAVRLAEENARLARQRFEEGALLSTQLTEAEAGLTEARVRRAVAETDVGVSTAALRRALGLFPIASER